MSLVPHEWMHANDTWFLVLFGPEILARSLLSFRKESLPALPGRRPERGWRAPSVFEVSLLVLDLLAVISFLPVVASTLVSASWLRVFRLTRTVLLLRYWAPVVRDLWTVTWRPERRRQLMFVFGSLLVTCFAGAVLLDHSTSAVGDDFDGDGVVGDPHDHEFLVRMWWAFRQLEDPGNLLASPHDSGTLIVSIFLTLVGLFLISFIIGIGTDVVDDLSELGRIRPPGLSRHTVIVNATTSGKRLLRELLHEEFKLLPAATEVVGFRWLVQLWRNVRTRKAFVVIGRESERPDFLNEPEFTSVVYRAWEDGDDDTLVNRGDVLTARRIVLLAGEEDHQPDDDTIRTALSIVEQLRSCEDNNPRRLFAEIVNLDNLPAAGRAVSRAAAPLSTVVVPTEPLIARCVAAVCQRQGLAELLTQLLRSEGREIYAWERDAGSVALPASAGPTPLETFARGGSSASNSSKRVVPLGLIVGEPGGSRAVFAPGPVSEANVQGVIAIADNATRVADLVADHAGDAPTVPVAKFEAHFEVERAAALRNILVCGFRNGTVQLLETLLQDADAGALVLILVPDEEGHEQVLLRFATQRALVRQGLVHAPGIFVSEDDTVRWMPSDQSAPIELRVLIADSTSPRSLGDLPGSVTSAIDFDLILFSADGSGESDARNTTGLMTIEALAAARGDTRWPRVVAEVDDVELAERLNARYVSMDRPQVHVFSIDELRALVVFQSVVVPHFGSIYDELLAANGRGLVPLRVSGGPALVPYPALAETLRAQGRILVAVDDLSGNVRFGSGHGPNDGVDLARTRLWVVGGSYPPSPSALRQ